MSHISEAEGRRHVAALGASHDRSGLVRPAPVTPIDDADRTGRDSFAARQSRSASVAILLCTFNGARFLPFQLASFEAQDFADWQLFVSDDGSEDETLTLLMDFQRKHRAGRVQIRRGPGKGANANFLSLICDPSLDSEYYALSDQDDVWAADKLARARSFLMKTSADVPCVYCTRTRLIDAQGAEVGLTQIFKKPPHFRNALVQNIAIGNTTVFNEKTRRLLMQAGADVNVAVHDWWIYLVAAAAGGTVFFDPYPSVNYRIHGGNLVGVNKNRVRRAWKILHRFKGWNDSNMQALERIQGVMLQENRKTFELFRQARQRSLLPRLYGLARSGIYREKIVDNIGLALAALIGKI